MITDFTCNSLILVDTTKDLHSVNCCYCITLFANTEKYTWKSSFEYAKYVIDVRSDFFSVMVSFECSLKNLFTLS